MKKIITLVLTLALVLTFVGCNAAPAATSNEAGALKLGRVVAAPHGTRGFGDIVVVMNGDKVAAASINEYQFMAPTGVTAVPNSDAMENGGFGSNYKDPAAMVLASKLVNSDAYSKNMKEKGGATKALADNYHAIEAWCVGKTIAEIEKVANGTTTEIHDTVSGATLEDTKGYLMSIVEAAKAAK